MSGCINAAATAIIAVINAILLTLATRAYWLRRHDWKFRYGIKDRVFVAEVHVFQWLKLEDLYSIGFRLQNRSIYLVKFEIDYLKTEINEKCLRDKSYERDDWEIHPEEIFWFDDLPIPVKLSKEGIIKGSVEARLNFGRKGIELDQSLVIHKLIHFRVGKTGEVIDLHWIDGPNE